MEKRIDTLIDLAEQLGNTYLKNELAILKLEIEKELLKAEINQIKKVGEWIK